MRRGLQLFFDRSGKRRIGTHRAAAGVSGADIEPHGFADNRVSESKMIRNFRDAWNCDALESIPMTLRVCLYPNFEDVMKLRRDSAEDYEKTDRHRGRGA